MIYTWVLFLTGPVTHDLFVGSLYDRACYSCSIRGFPICQELLLMIYTWVLYMPGAVTHDLYVGSLYDRTCYSCSIRGFPI